MKRSYKTLFRGVEWKRIPLSQIPSKIVCVDGDSLVFRYLLDFIDSQCDPKYVNGVKGAKAYGWDFMEKKLVTDVSAFSIKKLETIISLLFQKGVQTNLVFGMDDVIPRKKLLEAEYKKRELASKKKLSLCTFGSDPKDFTSAMSEYLLNKRNDVRNMVKKNIKDIYEEDIEPDISCPGWYDMIASEDYDLFLFGGQSLIKNITEDAVDMLSIGNLLKQLNFENLRQLTSACVLCGTDYNEGIKGIGPVKSKAIATGTSKIRVDPDEETMNFFLAIQMKNIRNV